MNNQTVARLRLAAQHIGTAPFETPEDAVRNLLAMQSQDYNGALWSIALRTRGATLQDVEQAVRERKIVRTWPMRGTLHFLHADDVHWMVDLLASRATAAARGRRVSQLGLTDDIMHDIEAVLREILSDQPVRRDQLLEQLQKAVKSIDIDNNRFGHVLRHFAETGLLCFGPHDGKQPTFVLLDAWITPPLSPKPRTAALKELAERYFKSHGPASLKDFAGWGMLTMADARSGLAQADGLTETIVNDTPYFHDGTLAPVAATGTLLLPGFDEYVLGYKDRSAILQIDHALKVVPGNNGIFKATVVHDGQLVGTWKRLPRKVLCIEYDWFDRPHDLSPGALQRYATFLAVK